MTSTATYDVVVGTGGIGTGICLALQGNHTIGREESRAAALLDQRDYCKLHIVCHYVQRLLGPDFPVVPIGKVGDDDNGRAVTDEMRATGMDMSFVAASVEPTLFSVCFLYPGGEGGNLTTSGSASHGVGPQDIRRARAVFAAHRRRGIAVALPEVPLEARGALLEMATDHAFLRVAAFIAGELDEAISRGLFGSIDLLAINLDEATAIARCAGTEPPPQVVDAALRRLQTVNPALQVVVTAGRHGSWTWDGRARTHAPALDVKVVNTAGAGDAHLAALIVATQRGCDLATANRFAGLVSGISVTSRDTIDRRLTPASLAASARLHGLHLDPALF
jgi:ribokinase